ncbi:protein tweety homolog 2, partial [Puma concolor]|uniref:Protein tweety homolog n=1 Tax=Puma concolor TaxID=9696 RepID=A0A6P6I563_PUMCO
HLGLRLQPVNSTFNPRDESYRESLMFLGLVAAVCLGLNLIFLAAYMVCACCCRRDEAIQTKRRNSCCVTWTAVVAGLVCCAAVGVGFYGNSETNDGVYQLIYSLDNANHTFSGIDALVRLTGSTGRAGRSPGVTSANSQVVSLGSLSHKVQPQPEHLDTALGPNSGRGFDLIARSFSLSSSKTLIPPQPLAGDPIPGEGTGHRPADQGPATSLYVQHLVKVTLGRAKEGGGSLGVGWLSYLLLFILDLLICLVACLGLARRSRGLLASMLCCGVLALLLSWTSLAADTAAAVGTSDFCSAPDTFILNITEDHIRTEVTRYYLYCSQSVSSPFQQALTIFQRSLTTMQIQVAGLLQFAVPLFPTAEKDLLGIQLLLNSSESGLHQLTAMLDCRGLHKDYLDALAGICYDGIEGLLYLGLFSLLAALAFSTMICAGPRAWKHFTTRDRDYDDIDGDDPFNPQARRIAAHNPPRGQLRSFCSYSSGLGSQTSLQPPAQTISNAPVSEYMNQAMLFGGNPRYENVPLIGRGSPPPTYSPSMRATYLSVADEHLRHYGNEFPA